MNIATIDPALYPHIDLTARARRSGCKKRYVPVPGVPVTEQLGDVDTGRVVFAKKCEPESLKMRIGNQVFISIEPNGDAADRAEREVQTLLTAAVSSSLGGARILFVD